MIDVRQANEYEAFHVPGSVHIAAGSLPDRLDELPRDHPIVTICAAGLRAAVAASILRARRASTDVSWVASGVPAWRAAGPSDGPRRPAEPGSRPDTVPLIAAGSRGGPTGGWRGHRASNPAVRSSTGTRGGPTSG